MHHQSSDAPQEQGLIDPTLSRHEEPDGRIRRILCAEEERSDTQRGSESPKVHHPRKWKSVFLTQRVHLFPFRTQKLSFAVPTILHGRLCGKIGQCQHIEVLCKGDFDDTKTLWGCSSVGRAPALQAGGHGFESHHLHHWEKQWKDNALAIESPKSKSGMRRGAVVNNNTGVLLEPRKTEARSSRRDRIPSSPPRYLVYLARGKTNYTELWAYSSAG